MLSDLASKAALALRRKYGSNAQGVGPGSAKALIDLVEMSGSELSDALDELEGLGFIRVDRGIGTAQQDVPRELHKIVGVAILEPLQEHFDQLGYE